MHSLGKPIPEGGDFGGGTHTWNPDPFLNETEDKVPVGYLECMCTLKATKYFWSGWNNAKVTDPGSRNKGTDSLDCHKAVFRQRFGNSRDARRDGRCKSRARWVLSSFQVERPTHR